jgi:hypothetical protein
MGQEATQSRNTSGGFSFSNTPIHKLGATEYTIVEIILDLSGSVVRWARDLEKCVKAIVEACRHSPRSENLLLRILGFNNSTFEIHGFVELMKINVGDYDNQFQPHGSTSLYDAALDGVESVNEFAAELATKDIFANALVVIVSDGDENNSTSAYIGTPANQDRKKFAREKIAQKIVSAQRQEVLESLKTILVGVFDPTTPDGTYLQAILQEFKDEAEIDEFVVIGDASKSALAKLAGFISQSISWTSTALNTGGPSQPVSPAFVTPIDLNNI